MRRIRRLSWIAGLFAISVIGACDDGGKSPFAPTAPGSPPPATISGIVKNLAASQPPPISSSFRTVGAIGMTVTVVGINVGTVADAEGRFTLAGVRPGPVQLQFTGAGVDAVLDLDPVLPGATVNIVVSVDGSTAVLVAKSSDSDVPVDDEDADDIDDSDADDEDPDDADEQEDDDADDAEDDDVDDNDD